MYTLFVIFMTLMLSSGIIVWLISIFNQKIKRPLVLLIGCLFWPLSLIFIYTYLFLYNRVFSKESFFS
jgi:hypothetical protein